MSGTAGRFLDELKNERVAKGRALDGLLKQGAVAEGQIGTFLEFYKPAVKLAADVDDRDQLSRLMNDLVHDIKDVDRVREKLIQSGFQAQVPEVVHRIQFLLAALERLLTQLRKIHADLLTEQWTFFNTQRNLAMLATKQAPGSRGKPQSDDEKRPEEVVPDNKKSDPTKKK
jgi:hypothetical protein